MLQADLYNKLSQSKELTFGLPPSRLGRADASIALRSLLPSIVISTVVERSLDKLGMTKWGEGIFWGVFWMG